MQPGQNSVNTSISFRKGCQKDRFDESLYFIHVYNIYMYEIQALVESIIITRVIIIIITTVLQFIYIIYKL